MMKDMTVPAPTFARRLLTRSLAQCMPGIGVLLLAATAARAESFYLAESTSTGMDWNTLSVWNSEPDGSGRTPETIAATGNFFTNNQGLRAPGTPSAFPGASLTLQSAKTGTLLLQAFGETRVARLIVSEEEGGNVTARNGGASGNWQVLMTDRLEMQGRLRLQAPSDDGIPHRLLLRASTIEGGGNIVCRAMGETDLDGEYGLQLGDSSQYSGNVIVAAGTLVAVGDLKLPQSTLEISEGAKCRLEKNIEVAQLVVQGVVIGAGVYSAADLNIHYPDTFSSNGTITIR